MVAPRISRRDFLKLLGYGTLAVGLGGIVRFSSLPELMRDFSRPVSAQNSGSWSSGRSTTCVAIHIALLPSGKIFYLAGSGYHGDRPNGPFEARIYDPVTDSEKDLPLSEDLFCARVDSPTQRKCSVGRGNAYVRHQSG